MPKEKPIIMLGDIHGEFEKLKWSIKLKNITDCYIIQVGDFGVGFLKPDIEFNRLKDLNKFLKSRNITMIAIRGNHDNPTYFNGSVTYSNLLLLPDYSTMTLNGLKYLFVGGALSIDRRYRQSLREDRSYWEDEVFVYDENLLKEAFPPSVDVLITHTTTKTIIDEMKALAYLNETLVDMFAIKYYDDTLKEELDAENIEVEKLFNQLPNLKYHFFGHYHTSFKMKLDRTESMLLDIFEMYEFRPKIK